MNKETAFFRTADGNAVFLIGLNCPSKCQNHPFHLVLLYATINETNVFCDFLKIKTEDMMKVTATKYKDAREDGVVEN